MIVDSSAIVAILLREPDGQSLADRLMASAQAGVAAPTLLEAGVVLMFRLPTNGAILLQRFVQAFDLVVIPFGDLHWQVAMEAYDRYGKGRHPAALNYGDCISYATAKLAGAPLLFKGNDFTQTDVEAA